MIYIFLLLFLFYLSYHYDYLGNKTYKKFFFNISLIVLILLSGLRYRIGLDTIRYENSYAFIPIISNLSDTYFQDSSYEPLYNILASLAKTISSEFWVLQMLQAILVNVTMFRFIRLNTNNIFLGVLLYYICLYLNFNCEVMREACAVSMILLGWESLKKDKLIPFTFFCILATGFHISAIGLLLIPILKITPLWNILRVNKFIVPLLIIFLIIGYTVQTIFFEQLALLSLGDSFSSKVTRYADSDLSKSVLNINGIISTVCRYILLPILAIINLKKIKNSDINNLEQMVLFSLIVSVLTVPIALFYRYSNYFFPFAIIAICKMAYSSRFYFNKKHYIKARSFVGWYVILLPLLFFQLYGYNSTDGNPKYKAYMRYHPYESIITKEIDQNRESLFNFYNAY